ncbi:DRAP deaminase [Histoplasma capsulatum G186AR]|uniref:DRAP deaminase n=1 Tax=Ajellomyces capsulatus TaxID=5037 RepID=A0A8H7YXS2_AJECA|nr:DRAP deaminase [Histoplasma capsulatum]QSS67393.1 DRAP deaminase [Histoplasma capsulatum G186AR]
MKHPFWPSTEIRNERKESNKDKLAVRKCIIVMYIRTTSFPLEMIHLSPTLGSPPGGPLFSLRSCRRRIPGLILRFFALRGGQKGLLGRLILIPLPSFPFSPVRLASSFRASRGVFSFKII